MELLGLVLAGVVGVSLGLLGGGGSILTVPILTYVFGFEAKRAIAMSLPVVGGTSLIGAYRHWRLGNVEVRTAATFGFVTIIGAYVGARLAVLLSGAAQLTLLALVMLASSISMIRSGARSLVADQGAARERSAPLLIAIGLGTGALTGLLGIGGGFFIVPALVLVAGVEMKQAIGTSLLVIAMNTASGLLGYLGHVPIDWGTVATFTGIAALGAIGGAWSSARVSAGALKRAFGVVLMVVAVLMLAQNRQVLMLRHRPPAPNVR
jgi:uncharacterized membrane protein YfcA